MKKWLVFLLGVLTGIFVSVISVYTLHRLQISSDDDNIKIFEKVGDVIDIESFRVIQVIGDGFALVHGKEGHDVSFGTVFLITNDEDKYYYDNEIINVPYDKEVRQIGIYKYPTKNDDIKTVPIIMIMDK